MLDVQDDRRERHPSCLFSPLLSCACPNGLTLCDLDPSDQRGNCRGDRGWLTLSPTRRNFPKLRWKVRRHYRVSRVTIWVRDMSGSPPRAVDVLPRRSGSHVVFSYMVAVAAIHVCTEPA